MKFNDSNSFFAEFDKEKNGCSIEEISSQKEKVWWICELGHSWKTTTLSRRSGSGCPYCNRLYPIQGENDFFTLYPHIAEEWDYNKNLVNPKEFFPGSEKKVWWIGKNCKHEWDMSVEFRALRGYNCPYCSGSRILTGFNDFATKHPELLLEWNYDKNTIDPTKVGVGVKNKVWWICNKNHEWNAPIISRHGGYRNCPTCDSLGFLYPNLLKEWDYSKNREDPNVISKGTHKKFWWICNKSHNFHMSVANRTRKNQQCPICKGRKVKVGFNDLPSQNEKIFKEWNYEKNIIDPYNLTSGSNKKVWWKCLKGHEWEANISDRKKGNGCGQCSKGIQASKGEKELLEFIKNIVDPNEKIETNVKKPLNNKFEIDIYLPRIQIGIEFNGVYYHSEKFVDKNYHYNKWKMAKENNIQLIQIWEDDWNNKKEIIKKSLTHKLNKNEEKIYARKTICKEISISEAKEFANKNHIQGFVNGSKYLSLTNHKTQQIVALMIMKEYKNGKIYLERYCTSLNVVGGFSKLLKNMTKIFPNSEKIITFADHSISDGGLYEKNGFIKESELRPDYSYLVKSIREHKFNYRLKRFKNDPNLIWEDGLTEKELAQLNNLKRIWDCGKTKFVKILKKEIQEQ